MALPFTNLLQFCQNKWFGRVNLFLFNKNKVRPFFLELGQFLGRKFPRPLGFILGEFWVLRPKNRPPGNSGLDWDATLQTKLWVRSQYKWDSDSGLGCLWGLFVPIGFSLLMYSRACRRSTVFQAIVLVPRKAVYQTMKPNVLHYLLEHALVE